MHNTLQTLAATTILFVAALSPGCSQRTPTTPPLLVEKTLLGLSLAYLDNLAHKNAKKVARMVLWPEYMKNKGPKFDLNAYAAQLESLPSASEPKKHPFLDLSFKSIDVRENHARVTFLKEGPPGNYPVWIDFVWAGGGWMVTNDAIFGNEGCWRKARGKKSSEPASAEAPRQEGVGASALHPGGHTPEPEEGRKAIR